MPAPQGGPIQFVQLMELLEVLGDGWQLTVVLGVLAGFIVRFATTRKRTVGLISTCLYGVAGAFIGVWVAAQLGIDTRATDIRFIAALGGSILLALAGSLLPRRARRKP